MWVAIGLAEERKWAEGEKAQAASEVAAFGRTAR